MGPWAHHSFFPVEGAVCFSRNATFPRGWMETSVNWRPTCVFAVLKKCMRPPRELPTGLPCHLPQKVLQIGACNELAHKPCPWHGFFFQRVSRNEEWRARVISVEAWDLNGKSPRPARRSKCDGLQRGFIYARISCFLAWLVLLLILLFFQRHCNHNHHTLDVDQTARFPCKPL